MHVSSLQVVAPPIFFQWVVLGAANEEGTWLHNSNCSFASARLRIRRTKQKAKVLFFFFLRKLRKEKEAFFECPPFFPLRDAKKKKKLFPFFFVCCPAVGDGVLSLSFFFSFCFHVQRGVKLFFCCSLSHVTRTNTKVCFFPRNSSPFQFLFGALFWPPPFFFFYFCLFEVVRLDLFHFLLIKRVLSQH